MKKLLLLFVLFLGLNHFSSAQSDTLKTWPYVCQADSFPVTLSGWFVMGGFQLGSITHKYRNDSLLLKYYYTQTVGPAIPTPFRITLKFQTPNPAYYTIYAKRYFNNTSFTTSTTHIGVCMGPSGISENRTSKIEIYPNPTSGKIFLNELPINTSATLSDLTGKILFRKKITANHGELDLQKLPAGVYLLYLETEAGKTVRKIVKN